MKGHHHHHHDNPHHFIERILAGATAKEESAVSIRPAITPEILPESFQLLDASYASTQEPSTKSSSPIILDLENVKPSRGNADLADASATIASQLPPPSPLHAFHEENDVHLSGIKPPLNIAESGNTADYLMDESKSSASIKIEETANQENKSDDDNSGALAAARDRSRKREHFTSKTRIIGYVKRTKDRGQMPAEKAAQSSVPAEDTQRGASSGAGPVQTWSTSRTSHSSEPVVTINIGRIEVRAAMTPPSPPPQKSLTKTQQFTSLSLKEYLKQRSEGKI